MAFSRIKQGLAIVGDFEVLLRNSLWTSYMSEVLKIAPFAAVKHLDVLESSITQRNKQGLLQGRRRVSLLSSQCRSVGVD